MHTPHWHAGYASLGSHFVTHLPPQPLSAPYWVAHSPAATHDLGLDSRWLQGDDALLLFSGNALPENAQPWASVYSGHQFGVWAGQLGDGRALTLGALPDRTGQLQEIQLKGAGRTPYSRMGDGRAVLRSSIREWLASEAMHALGVPTTRALCLAGSPDPVYREQPETAAVVTRFAPSFVRFGHFEHFAACDRVAELRQLADYVIAHFYPDAQHHEQPYAILFQAVVDRTTHLVAQWQGLGFVHGVMNTDNMSILGLTIDYGPYQWLDSYDPSLITNHSDQRGRYTYQRQPDIAYWNLQALAHALVPLCEDTTALQSALNSYPQRFQQAMAQQWAHKLGITDVASAQQLANTALQQLLLGQTDFTIFWRDLARDVQEQNHYRRTLPRVHADWVKAHQAALERAAVPQAGQSMLQHNPAVVPRNYLCQMAISAAEQGDFTPLHEVFAACTSPYDTCWDDHPYSALPPAWAAGIAISCSS